MNNKLKLVIISIICLLSINTGWSQKTYSIKDIPLTWRDFNKRDASVNSRIAAQTNVKIDIEYDLNDKELVITLKITQSRDESWVSRQFLMKASDAESQRLLNHEKLHYVINLIGFKKIYMEMKDYPFTTDYKSEITSIFRKHTRDIDKFNSDYDKQTYHGTSMKNQTKWEEQIMSSFNDLYNNDDQIRTLYTIKTVID